MSSTLAKTVLVTGGCGGLGLAISKAFLAAGAKVVAFDLDTLLVSNFREDHASDKSIAIECDVTDEAALQRAFKSAIDKFGQLDVVVNNAGIMDKMDPVGNLDKKLWDQVVAVNLTAPYMISKLAVQHMLEKQIKGSIVNIGSIAAIRGFAAGAAYTASKHGLIGLTKNTAAFYHDKGIRCNAVIPAGMATNIGSNVGGWENFSQEGLVIAMKTMTSNPPRVDVEQVVSVVLFLCSEGARALNGACLTADNGWSSY